MIFKKLSIPDVVLIEPNVFIDDRGFFYESYHASEFADFIGRDVKFVQDNHSKSIKGVLRGLHYQIEPYEQAKLVRVTKGEVWDVAVDLRKKSETFGKWVGEILSESNKKQLWIPEGFAHGFYVLSDEAEFQYKVNQFYSRDHEKTIHWKNNDFYINWPIEDNLVLLSEKDNILSD